MLDRALAVQGELADQGLHRTVKLGDLVIAATAERAARREASQRRGSGLIYRRPRLRTAPAR